MGRCLLWLERILDGVVALGVVAISVLVVWQVVARYVFSASLSWSEEVATFVMIWTGLFGLVSLLRHGSFIAVDLFAETRMRALKSAARVVAVGATLAFMGLLVWLGLEMSVFSTGTGVSSAARIPLSWIYLAFPAAAALVILRLVARLRRPGPDRGGRA